MTWHAHINRIIEKASNRVTTLSRVKYKLPRPALQRIYLTMIRPILEYGDIIFDNCSIYLKNKLESVQRRAAIICTNAYRHTDYNKLLLELGWDSLHNRRKTHKLTMLYKIHNNLTPRYLKTPLPAPHPNRYNLRHNNNFPTIHTRLTCVRESFYPSVLREWNLLTNDTVNLPTLPQFKAYSKNKVPKPKLYSKLCIGKPGAWLTRIRMGLSALNAQRFTYNFIDSPICEQCNQSAETPQHYFLACQSYVAARQTLLDTLRLDHNINIFDQQHLLNTILNGTSNTIINTGLYNAVCEYMTTTNRFK